MHSLTQPPTNSIIIFPPTLLWGDNKSNKTWNSWCWLGSKLTFTPGWDKKDNSNQSACFLPTNFKFYSFPLQINSLHSKVLQNYTALNSPINIRNWFAKSIAYNPIFISFELAHGAKREKNKTKMGKIPSIEYPVNIWTRPNFYTICLLTDFIFYIWASLTFTTKETMKISSPSKYINNIHIPTFHLGPVCFHETRYHFWFCVPVEDRQANFKQATVRLRVY